MVRLAPFRALRHDPAVAGPAAETSAPPYDDLDPFRYTAHRTTNPYTVLELLTGEAATGAAAHDAARATLERWQRTGVLVHDPEPSLYLYEQHELRHGAPAVQRGVIGTIDLGDLDDGSLLLHEHVDPGRVGDRVARLRAVPLDLTPVVAVHLDVGVGLPRPADLPGLTARPIAAFTDVASVDHRLWRIDDHDLIRDVVAAHHAVRAVLADGHHRIAAAERIRAERLAAGLPVQGWGRTTVWLVDAVHDGPELRAVHRLLATPLPSDMSGEPHLSGFRTLRWHGSPADLERTVADAPGLCYGAVCPSGSWLLRAVDPDALRRRSAAVVGPDLAALDAQVLASEILPALGAPTAEAAFDVEVAAAEAVRRGGTLLVLRPPVVRQVMAIAAAGQRMPAKTTWFRPKPRAGLVMRRMDEDDDSPHRRAPLR